ncbi:MAG TPA: hydroxymethylbilane synthase [Spirochaetes bacterium]|nr:hydroxymethylbilane synthase [Spirochaetota bacterium]
MKNKKIKIGTRGSKLALIQAEKVRDILIEEFPELNFELVIIKTKGDKILDSPLSKLNDKGLFTKELEKSLLKNETDLAVHSLKDLPTEFPENLTLGAVLERGEVRDVIISRSRKKLQDLTGSDVFGTSSLRRRAQLLHYNSSFRIKDIRGNVDTRLKKLEEGFCDVLILAGAGVQRSGYSEKITEYIDPEIVMPSVSQGIIGIEFRMNDVFINGILRKINHKKSFITASAERTFLRTIEGGCQVPCGCISTVSENTFSIKGMISDLEGREVIKKSLAGPLERADKIAGDLGKDILDAGGREIFARIRDNGVQDWGSSIRGQYQHEEQ